MSRICHEPGSRNEGACFGICISRDRLMRKLAYDR